MLAEYVYRPRIHGIDPLCVPLYYPQAQCMALEAPYLQRLPARTTSAHSRSGLSSAGGRTRTATHAPPSAGVVVHDNPRRTASAPA
jgi:hypothetical protein